MLTVLDWWSKRIAALSATELSRGNLTTAFDL
jgi:hypothetical protein